jgi:hypothetical protein
MEKTDPARWKVREFLELHPWGVVVLIRRCPAYLADDEKGWDVVEEVSIGGDTSPNNPWRKAEDNHDADQLAERAWFFWRALPEARQGWLLETTLIRFEDIHDVDEKGDKFAAYPHIFVTNAPTVRSRYLEPMNKYASSQIEPSEETRVKFFPDEFPERPPYDNIVPD